MHRKIFALLAVLVAVVMVAGVSSGQNKPGFSAPSSKSATSAPAPVASAPASNLTPMPGSTAWTDGLYHAAWGNIVSKGAVAISNVEVVDGKLLFVARISTDDRFHVVLGDKMHNKGYFGISELKASGSGVISFSGLDGQELSEYEDVENFEVKGRHSVGRRDSGMITGVGHGISRPVPTMPPLPSRMSHGIQVRDYILANGEPLLVHCDDDSCRVWWGEAETRPFARISDLAFENGKVSYTARNADKSLQVFWGGAESPKYKEVDPYELVDGKPMYCGTGLDGKSYIGEGVTRSAPFEEIVEYGVEAGKSLYIARRAVVPVPAKKL
ncbi:MAG: hypothetical protein PHC53_00240 [Patescibacteria group bacterium]|nr:hypothetical protein [Patescibacteria group bacterium]